MRQSDLRLLKITQNKIKTVKSQGKRNTMRRQNGNVAVSRKRQRLNGSTDVASPASPPPLDTAKKITDLNDDCLDRTFDHLDFLSLFKVAVSNEYLRPAARVVYKRKFGNKVVNLFEVLNQTQTGHPFSVCAEKVGIFQFKTCLQFLRCFGSSISKLQIYYNGSNSKRYDHVHQYINTYCAESLVEFELIIKPRISIHHFEKPFVNVRNVTVHYSYLGDQFPQLSEWFPNVRVLKLFKVRTEDHWTVSPFHHLEVVHIAISNGTDGYGFTKREAATLLQSSHQLRCVEIDTPSGRQGMTFNTLLNIVAGKSLIEELSLKMDKYSKVVKLSEVQRLINEHPLLVELYLPNYKFTVANLLLVIRQLNSLKKFYFQLNDVSEYEHFSTQFRSDGEWKPIFRGFRNVNVNYYVELTR